MSAAAIHNDFQTIDVLTSVPTIEVKGSALRAGMVLVDELDAPTAGLDHKVRATRNSGSVAFLVTDLVKGGWFQTSFAANKTFRVAAR